MSCSCGSSHSHGCHCGQATCCCPLDVRLSSRVSVCATAIPEAVNVVLNDAKSASAVASTTSTHDAQSSDVDTTTRNVFKTEDGVVLNTRYQIDFEVSGGCRPIELSIATTAPAPSLHPCLPCCGTIVLTSSTFVAGTDIPTRPRRTMRVEAIARDKRGSTARCLLEIPEP